MDNSQHGYFHSPLPFTYHILPSSRAARSVFASGRTRPTTAGKLWRITKSALRHTFFSSAFHSRRASQWQIASCIGSSKIRHRYNLTRSSWLL